MSEKNINKICRMFWGLIGCLSFMQISVWLQKEDLTVLSEMSDWVAAYVFLYFFIFSIIDSGVDSMASFHQTHNQQNLSKSFLGGFIKNKINFSKGYKLMFNVGFLFMLFFRVKNEFFK
ncbi:hypothetical protein [Pseudocitrobacter corydidari]